MGSLGRAVLDLFVNNKGLTSGMAAAESQVRRSMATMGKTGQTLTRRLTLPVVAAGAASVKMAVDYEESLSKITGLVGVSQKQVDVWGKQMLELGPKVGKGPRELAEAMFFITSAGLKGKTAMQALVASAKASTAGLGETKVVADAVTSAMNAYGAENLSASQATDILTAAVREGKLEASALAPAIGRAIPIASAMGVSFDEVAASLAAMSRTGTDASTGATQLRAILAGLLKPTVQAEDALKKYGLSGDKVRKMLREDGLISTLQHLNKATKGNKKALAEIFPNIRALSGFLDLLGGNADANITIYEKLAKSIGSTDKAFQDAAQSGRVKLDQAISSIQAAAIMIGDILLPYVVMAADFIRKMATEFRKLPEPVKKAAVVFFLVVAALGPLMILMASLFTVTGLIVVGIGALVAALVASGVSFQQVQAIVQTVVTWLQANVPPIFETIKSAAITAFNAIKSVAAPVVAFFISKWNEVSASVRRNSDDIKKTVSAVVNFVLPLIRSFLSNLKSTWQAGWNLIKAVVQVVWGVLKAVITTGIKLIGAALALGMAIIRGDWAKAWEALKDLVKAAITGAISILKALLTGAARVAGPLAKFIAVSIWNGIKTVGKLLGALAGLLIGKITSAVSAAGTAAFSWAVGIGSKIVSGILSGLGGLVSAVKNKIESGIKSVLSNIDVPGFSPVDHAAQKAIGEPIVKGAVKGLATLTTKMKKELSQSVRDALTSARDEATSAGQSLAGIVNDVLSAKADRQISELDNSPLAQQIRAIQEGQDAAAKAAERASLQDAITGAETPEDRQKAVAAMDAWLIDQEKQRLQAELDAQKAKIAEEAQAKSEAYSRNVADLTDALNRGLINQQTYNQAMIAQLRATGVNYAEVGNYLGTSMANSFNDAMRGVYRQARRIPQLIARANALANVPGLTAKELKSLKNPKNRALFASSFGGGPEGINIGNGVTINFTGTVIGAGNERELADQLARIIGPALDRRVTV